MTNGANPLWQERLPKDVFKFLVYTASANYSVERLVELSTESVKGLEERLGQAQARIVHAEAKQSRGNPEAVVEKLKDSLAQSQRSAQRYSELLSETEQAQSFFGVTSTVVREERKNFTHTDYITLNTPVGILHIVAHMKPGEMSQGLKQTENAALRFIASKSLPVPNGHFYKVLYSL